MKTPSTMELYRKVLRGELTPEQAADLLTPPHAFPWLGVAVLATFLAALLLFLSCSTPTPPPAARIPAGDYTLRVFVDRSDGTCSWIKDLLTTPMHIDSSGQISSPLPGASCTTTYGTWIAFACDGFGAKLTAHGVLETSGADGTGEIRGNISGCTFVAFTFQLVRR